MTTEEFSNQFDVLLDSYRRFKDFDKKEELDSIEFNEYEKSLYLTQALNNLIYSWYQGSDSDSKSFEEVEKNRRALSELVKEAKLELKPNEESLDCIYKNQTLVCTLPENLWFITYENIKIETDDCHNSDIISVVPIKLDYYNKAVNNPFKRPSNKRAYRMDLSNNKVQIISEFTPSYYYIRYVEKPEPIILEDLPNDLTIDGKSKKADCKLNSNVHQFILELAVALAIRSKIPNSNLNNR